MIDFKNGKCWDLTNGQCGEQTPSNHFHSQDSIFGQKNSFFSKCEEENLIWINDMIPAVWLIVLKAGCSWGFSNSLIIYLSYWQSLFILENSQGEKTVWFANMGPIRIFMPTSITEKWPFYLYVSFHSQQLDAFTHVKALQFCPDI